MKKLVEFGIYERQHSRIITVKNIDGMFNARMYWEKNNIALKTDYDIQVNVVFLLDAVIKVIMSYGFSFAILLFEISFKYLRPEDHNRRRRKNAKFFQYYHK